LGFRVWRNHDEFIVEFDILGIILWYKQKQKLDREFDKRLEWWHKT
jgi:hypothetical protein